MKTESSLVEQAQRDILQYITNNSDSKELPKENDLSRPAGKKARRLFLRNCSGL